MIAFILAALSLPSPPVRCDLVEVNHYHNAAGEHVLDQLIFYSWSSQLNRYNVREWRLITCESMYPKRHARGFVVRWHDDGIMREVIARARRETVTQHDPELRERNQLPQESRTPLFAKGPTE